MTAASATAFRSAGVVVVVNGNPVSAMAFTVTLDR